MEFQVKWKPTIIDASRLIVDVVCYGALNCYSLILLNILRAFEQLSNFCNHEETVKEPQEAIQKQREATESDSQCGEIKDEMYGFRY